MNKNISVVHGALFLIKPQSYNYHKVVRFNNETNFFECENDKTRYAHKHWDEIEPLELTKEILLKNNFEYDSKADAYSWINENNEAIIVKLGGVSVVQGKRDGDYAPITKKRIRYAHELQQMVNICEIDKFMDYGEKRIFKRLIQKW